MNLELKVRTYDWRDLLRLPFACEPLCTTAVVGQKLLTSFVNVWWVLVEAKFIDTVLACALGKADIRDAYPILAVMLLIIFWKRMGWNLGRLPSGKLAVSAEYQAKCETVKKRSRLHYSMVEDGKTWELSQRVSRELGRNISNMLPNTCDFLMSIVRITGVVGILFAESVWLGVFMLLIMLPLVWISVKSGGHIYAAWQDASAYERRGEYLQKIMTDRDSADERTLFAYTDYVNSEWNYQKKKEKNLYLKAEGMQELRNAGSSVVTNVISTVIVFCLAWELYKGKLEVGIFIALSKAIYDIINLMYRELGYSISAMSRHIAFFKELTAFCALPEAEGANELPEEKPFALESLELQNVSFRYPGMEQYILKNVSLTIEKGGHYAFVGENGAGKTTVTKLLTGLYDEYEGKILLNGRELKSYAPSCLKSMFSNVYQDFARYHDTAANNILIGDIRHMDTKEAERRMENCAKALDIWEDLCALPESFDTPLGKLSEHSVDLSGGQWQRVAMARSLMNPAPVQILDEPTASLDPVSESRLYESFERISAGRTTIFISHRLGSTKLADKIYVLKDGRIAEEGTHEELIGRKALYAQMYMSQKSWYETTPDKEETADEARGGCPER